LDRRQVWEIAQSFKTYVQRCHHAKEDFLLSMVRARGGSSADYPFRTFYEEHHHIHSLLVDLAKAAREYLEAFRVTRELLVRSLRDAVDFYPGHMWKAEHLLFPLADELLSEADQCVLIEQFDWIESVVGSDVNEQLRAIVAEFRPEPSRLTSVGFLLGWHRCANSLDSTVGLRGYPVRTDSHLFFQASESTDPFEFVL
jgi:hemerythrin-like domain-containing protein